MAERQAKIPMVTVSILVALFLNAVTTGAATARPPIVSDATYESIQRTLKDRPSLPPFCDYVQPCSKSSCNPPKVCATFYQSSVCCDP